MTTALVNVFRGPENVLWNVPVTVAFDPFVCALFVSSITTTHFASQSGVRGPVSEGLCRNAAKRAHNGKRVDVALLVRAGHPHRRFDRLGRARAAGSPDGAFHADDV